MTRLTGFLGISSGGAAAIAIGLAGCSGNASLGGGATGLAGSTTGVGGSTTGVGGSTTALGGSTTGVGDTGGIATTGGTMGVAGSASSGGMNSGGSPQTGTGGYQSCAGKACGDSCRLCAPDDTNCGEIAVLKACDSLGQCVVQTATAPVCTTPSSGGSSSTGGSTGTGGSATGGGTGTTICSTTCSKDADCACGVNSSTRACALGNAECIDTSVQCPDYCTGINGDRHVACVNQQCTLAAGQACGTAICGSDEYCCNPLSNACTPIGMGCTV
jgi:hypothetical protein